MFTNKECIYPALMLLSHLTYRRTRANPHRKPRSVLKRVPSRMLPRCLRQLPISTIVRIKTPAMPIETIIYRIRDTYLSPVLLPKGHGCHVSRVLSKPRWMVVLLWSNILKHHRQLPTTQRGSRPGHMLTAIWPLALAQVTLIKLIFINKATTLFLTQ